MDYYSLSEEDKWLERGDSPYSIGGRDTDVSQIAFSLRYKVRELFTINEVPAEIVTQLAVLETCCKRAEKAIEETISLISETMVSNG